MTDDYIRHGTTTLFAALNAIDGTVLGRCLQRHRHQEFIRFLGAVEAAVPAGKVIHAILDTDSVSRSGPPTSIPRSGHGWSGTRAGSSTSRPPPAPG